MTVKISEFDSTALIKINFRFIDSMQGINRVDRGNLGLGPLKK